MKRFLLSVVLVFLSVGLFASFLEVDVTAGGATNLRATTIGGSIALDNWVEDQLGLSFGVEGRARLGEGNGGFLVIPRLGVEVAHKAFVHGGFAIYGDGKLSPYFALGARIRMTGSRRGSFLVSGVEWFLDRSGEDFINRQPDVYLPKLYLGLQCTL